MIVLITPWLLLVLLIASFIFLLKKKWKVSVVLIIALLVINWRCECFPFRISHINEKDNGHRLSVMSFNIDGSLERISSKAVGLAKIINNYNPDIVFLIEFSELFPDALDTLLQCDYPFTTYKSHVYYSNYFYSKYPILSHNMLLLGGYNNCFNGIFDINGSLISVYGCHLPSNNYTADGDHVTPDSIRNCVDLISYLKKIHLAYRQRESETSCIKDYILNDNSPIVLMGDINDVGGSLSIRNLKSAGLKDAWYQGGFGYGATIHKPIPYRIDHIMYSKRLKLLRIKVVGSDGLSDHIALYAEFEY